MPESLFWGLEIEGDIHPTFLELDDEPPPPRLYTANDLEHQRSRAQLKGVDGDLVVGKTSERAPEKPTVAGHLTVIVPAEYGQGSEGAFESNPDLAIVLSELLLADEDEAAAVWTDDRDIRVVDDHSPASGGGRQLDGDDQPLVANAPCGLKEAQRYGQLGPLMDHRIPADFTRSRFGSAGPR